MGGKVHPYLQGKLLKTMFIYPLFSLGANELDIELIAKLTDPVEMRYMIYFYI